MRTRGLSSLLFVLAGAALLATPASAVTIDWVFVGDPGNAPDTFGSCLEPDCGSVSYEYYISKYEVTNTQYAEFLNAKAAADPLGLWHVGMGSPIGGIARSGSSGSYTYAAKPGMENKPIMLVSFFDALRFINWLHNGQGSGDTETGAYTLLGGASFPSNGWTVTRNLGANVFLPTENEWYKAAYYDGLYDYYWEYPMRSNTITCAAPGPTPATANCSSPFYTDAGAYTGSASWYGTFDQGGNVAEWTEYSDGGFRVIRGGSAGTTGDYEAASWYTGAINPGNEGALIGFRVATLFPIPEPGTSLLVMTGLAGLAARRAGRKRAF